MHAHAYLAKSILQGAVNQFSLNWGGCLRLFSTLPKSNFALAFIQRNAQCIRSILKQVEQQASCHVVNWDIILHYFHLFSCSFAHFLPCFSTHKGIYAPKRLLQYVNINRFRDGLKWMSFKGPFLWTTCSKSSCWFETCQWFNVFAHKVDGYFDLFHVYSINSEFACVPELLRPRCVVLVAALLPPAIWRDAYANALVCAWYLAGRCTSCTSPHTPRFNKSI